jgi:hypothetical protein
MKNIDPTQYNLSSRVDLRQDRSGDLLIIIDRKSRIIMKDGIRVLEMVKKINKIDPKKNISVRTSAPICSKTKKLLLENNITTKPL